MSVAGEIEGNVAGRHKREEKAHSRGGTMGHAILLGRWERRRPRKRNGPVGRPGPTGPESKEILKSDLIFEFNWFF
jgi:hypothetical protein